MSPLQVQGLCKAYPSFRLQDVTFSLRPGKITGFIGRNGAGKSTTLKSLMHFVRPDSGDISFFGLPFEGHENEIKQRIGFMMGGVNYYGNKKLKTITEVTRHFYTHWDENAYRQYMRLFQLEESKTPAQLSEGMKVKYALTLALSHNAELLILDEPTSGLDPVSRDELLEVFLQLQDKGVSLLFSTHITSDLEKCADDILYLRHGRLEAAETLEHFVNSYRLVTLSDDQLTPERESLLVGVKRAKHGHTALVRPQNVNGLDLSTQPAALEDIMVHLEKEEL